MRVVSLLFFVPLAVYSLSAQEGGPELYSPGVHTHDSAAAITLPANPEPQPIARHRVVDKKFMAVMAALGVAEAMRTTSTTITFNRAAAEGAPWAVDRPSNGQQAAKFAGIYAVEALVTCELKKPHSWMPGNRVIRKFWWVYPATMAGFHLTSAIRSMRVQPPAGCTVDGCP